jgi:hypothetical protein
MRRARRRLAQSLVFVVPLSCGSQKPLHTQKDIENCPWVQPPRCAATLHAYEASQAERWGPELDGKTIAVRGPMGLKRFECQHVPSIDPAAACADLRQMEVAKLYIGPVRVDLPYQCACFVHGGRACPVDSPGKEAVVIGTYVYSPRPGLGYPEDQPPRHALKDSTKMCVTGRGL